MSVKDEGIKNINKYSGECNFTKKDCEEAISHIIKIIDKNLKDFTYKFPPPASKNLVYEPNAALQMIKALSENYTTVKTPESNGVLLHSVYTKPGKHGVDECSIWGDYYYFEALVRLYKNWKLYW